MRPQLRSKLWHRRQRHIIMAPPSAGLASWQTGPGRLAHMAGWGAAALGGKNRGAVCVCTEMGGMAECRGDGQLVGCDLRVVIVLSPKEACIAMLVHMRCSRAAPLVRQTPGGKNHGWGQNGWLLHTAKAAAVMVAARRAMPAHTRHKGTPGFLSTLVCATCTQATDRSAKGWAPLCCNAQLELAPQSSAASAKPALATAGDCWQLRGCCAC